MKSRIGIGVTGASVQNRVFFHRAGTLYPSFRYGVSLHGHTRHSSESLAFLGKFLDRRILLRSWVNHQRQRGHRNTGISMDLDRAYWTPPLCERQAYDLECTQIHALGLRSLVSLSDHDTIDACALLREFPDARHTPISTEWTVPFGRAIFHIGVHNLPPHLAASAVAALLAASKAALEPAIIDALRQLSEIPEVLLVFNHPLWNLNGTPQPVFAGELIRFLGKANGLLHAFELNGMRSHRENREVIQLAAEWNQVLIAGGDRHGCEPSAALNLTQASDFPEFVHEIRNGKQSTVLVMPQYEQPLCWRMYKSFIDVIEHYPAHPNGRRSWDQRIFHPDHNGDIVPVIDLWHLGPPGFLQSMFNLALSGSSFPPPRALSAFSFARLRASTRDLHLHQPLGPQPTALGVPVPHPADLHPSGAEANISRVQRIPLSD